MSCNNCCNDWFSLQGQQYCQDCMPDELQWLVPIKETPDPFLMDRHHAWITPDNGVYVLDHEGTKAVKINGGGGTTVVPSPSNVDFYGFVIDYKAEEAGGPQITHIFKMSDENNWIPIEKVKSFKGVLGSEAMRIG